MELYPCDKRILNFLKVKLVQSCFMSLIDANKFYFYTFGPELRLTKSQPINPSIIFTKTTLCVLLWYFLGNIRMNKTSHLSWAINYICVRDDFSQIHNRIFNRIFNIFILQGVFYVWIVILYYLYHLYYCVLRWSERNSRCIHVCAILSWPYSCVGASLTEIWG